MGAGSWGNSVSYSNSYTAQINEHSEVKVVVDFRDGLASNYYTTSHSKGLLCRLTGPPPPMKAIVPEEYGLQANYPNPFNPETHIRYALPEVSRVSIVIYDITGKEVRSWNMTEDAGFKNMTWNGTNNSGQSVPGGVYIYRLKTVSLEGAIQFTDSRKMILIK